jgi:hypothetical protein
VSPQKERYSTAANTSPAEKETKRKPKKRVVRGDRTRNSLVPNIAGNTPDTRATIQVLPLPLPLKGDQRTLATRPQGPRDECPGPGGRVDVSSGGVNTIGVTFGVGRHIGCMDSSALDMAMSTLWYAR